MLHRGTRKFEKKTMRKFERDSGQKTCVATCYWATSEKDTSHETTWTDLFHANKKFCTICQSFFRMSLEV